MGALGAIALGVAGAGLGLLTGRRSNKQQDQALVQQQMLMQNTQRQQQELYNQQVQAQEQSRATLTSNLAKDQNAAMYSNQQANAIVPPTVTGNEDPLSRLIRHGGLTTVGTSLSGDTSKPNLARRTLLGN